MSRNVEFEVLDESSNAIVARSPNREFPGVLLQGDTLRIILHDLDEASHLMSERKHAAASRTLEVLEDQLRTLLEHYEKALKAHDLPLPYSEPVG